MKALFVGVMVSLMSLSAVADDMPNGILCGEYGHVDSAEEFDRIQMKPVTSAFILTGTGVVHGNSSYMAVSPKAVGLEEGLAKTYYDFAKNKVLYIYQDERGAVEIGVSHQVKDSDAGFDDKSVYTVCTYLYPPTLLDKQPPPLYDTAAGKGHAVKTTFRF